MPPIRRGDLWVSRCGTQRREILTLEGDWLGGPRTVTFRDADRLERESTVGQFRVWAGAWHARPELADHTTGDTPGPAHDPPRATIEVAP